MNGTETNHDLRFLASTGVRLRDASLPRLTEADLRKLVMQLRCDLDQSELELRLSNRLFENVTRAHARLVKEGAELRRKLGESKAREASSAVWAWVTAGAAVIAAGVALWAR